MKAPALLLASALFASAAIHAAPVDDAATVAALDREYQAAVKHNDAATMARILADDFVLVAGNGRTYDRDALLAEARSAAVRYEQQDELEQQVRVWGDTAVVTAKLWVKGTREGEAFDRKLWFSDVYVRTADGWRYALGQVGQRE
jgi:ketosteroid isomerase-like protein